MGVFLLLLMCLLSFLFFLSIYLASFFFVYYSFQFQLQNYYNYFWHLRRMQTHNSLKKEFIKKWIKGLQICSSSKEKMSLMERKKAIKLSANLALASTKIGKRTWSHALINKATNDGETGNLAKQILGVDDDKNTNQLNNAGIKHIYSRKKIIARKSCNTKMMMKKKKSIISRKTCKLRSRNYKVMKARSMAKRLVKKRTQILKELVPGGEFMDDYCFFKETLDYVVSLQAQVDVMHHLANSSQLFDS